MERQLVDFASRPPSLLARDSLSRVLCETSSSLLLDVDRIQARAEIFFLLRCLSSFPPLRETPRIVGSGACFLSFVSPHVLRSVVRLSARVRAGQHQVLFFFFVTPRNVSVCFFFAVFLIWLYGEPLYGEGGGLLPSICEDSLPREAKGGLLQTSILTDVPML